MTTKTLHQQTVQDFLTAARKRADVPATVLQSYPQRRQGGLRRAEVAEAAHISIDYYTRIERGSLKGVSPKIIDSISSALQLNMAEEEYLHLLAEYANSPQRMSQKTILNRSQIRPSLKNSIHSFTETPAYIRDFRMNILEANSLAQKLFNGALVADYLPLNLAHYAFLDPVGKNLLVEEQEGTNALVAALRMEWAKYPEDRQLAEIIHQLMVDSELFARLWNQQRVIIHRSMTKTFRNEAVGLLELTGDSIEIPEEGLTVITYSAEPNSPAWEKLQKLHRAT